jgi:TonB family protein
MNAVWKDLEGHAVNGLPLLRCVASSEHSGVFRTESAKHASSALTVKLVRIDPTSADAQLSRWLAATHFAHAHLIRMFEAGRCQVGELHCLYVLMEHADQNLAQLLNERALAQHEAREMLAPTLDALAYVHERRFVLGQLKPSNILAVGDQVKLASDTVRAAGESAGGASPASAYDPPEARDGMCSAAGDIWALGMTLCEGLTRRQPSGLHEEVGQVELPSDLHPPFREIVARCLSRSPRDRPKVAELQAWLRNEEPATGAESPLPPAAVMETTESPPASVAAAEPTPDAPSTIRLVIRAQILPDKPDPVAARQDSSKRALALAVGAVALLALVWAGVSVLRTDPASTPAVSEEARDVEPQSSPAAPAPPKPVPVISDKPAPKPAPPTTEKKSPKAKTVEARSTTAKPVEPNAQRAPDASPTPINEVVPNVPRSASQTIRGTIRVSVQVIVGKDGTVLEATAEEPGPSRYFERLSLAAAKKWTFEPADTDAQRTALLRFYFTRERTTARAEPRQ